MGRHPFERIGSILEAVVVIGSESQLPVVLRDITQAAVDVLGVGSGALRLLADEGKRGSEMLTVGLPADQFDFIAGQPAGRGILGTRSYLAVPIQGAERLLGHLYLVERREATEFSDDDASLACGFAAAAALAIDHANLGRRVHALTLIEDRERIAVDLHDTVTQRLFAVSLSLQGTVKAIASPEAAQRVATAVDDLDQTIQQVRAAIFTP
jgi:signal transduction histidine kinase